ncbi:MAG TPA: hypothetical protein VL283_02225 [Candidatus Baltobacteraceae bacterium]|jgi:hypothetical protein|nr:hypothetical protein [Candidatus Baltobacteraceae bacterium]
MRGPYLVTALPDDLSGFTTELFTALHRLALACGDLINPEHRLLMVKNPLLVSVLATTLPDQLRMTVSRLPGALFESDAILIFLTEDGHNYVLLDGTIAFEELAGLAAAAAPLDRDPA